MIRPRARLVLAAALLAAACAPRAPAPVVERAPAPPARPLYRVVNPGDTLYSIAWEADLDHRRLARWNRIPPPYRIRPGQRLRLRPPSGAADRAAPGRASAPAPRGQRPAGRRPVPAAGAAAVVWQWPLRGRVIRRFNPRRRSKGIDIAAPAGTPVRAAAAGRVVYRGSGLRGYGRLIIIKHDETFLSAYAHNKKILVRQGQRVRRGERIATVGRSGTDRDKLHFEIRHRGRPVDPLRYLPGGTP